MSSVVRVRASTPTTLERDPLRWVVPDDATIPIDELLREAGFDTPAGATAARTALEAAGLTRAGKRGIAAYKRDAALRALDAAFVRVCSQECARLASAGRDARTPAVTSSAACEVCGGSNNRRAAIECARVLRANRVRCMVVVGGTQQNQHELQSLLGSKHLELVLVDGTARSVSQKDAQHQMKRAQLMVVWGSTPLRHAVSNMYTTEPPPGLRVITVARRGIAALCGEVVRSYRK